MFQDGWEETVTAQSVQSAPAGVGCLLQIHPLDISGHLVELTQDQTVVGREPGCGLSIPNTSVSRRHALIEHTNGVYRVSDLGSTNGTCVNEQRVQSAELATGDRLQFGSHIYKFLSTNHIEMQYHEAVYSMMTRDGLTGTLNKRSFQDILAREFQRSVHRQSSLSLVMFDIDHFKSVNDGYGHLAGDEVLQETGRRVREVIASHDVFARYGGEEFAILLSDVTLGDAVGVAERCRHAIESAPFATSATPLEITISCGVAEVANLTAPQQDSELVQAADEKLYEAKRSGRNRVCY